MSDTERPGDPCVIVIFGASGDLCKRKLIPALYNLRIQNLLPENVAVIGVSNRPMTHEEFRSYMDANLREFADKKVPRDRVAEFVKCFYYQSGNFNEDAAYQGLAALLSEVDQRHQTGGNFLYYLSVPPIFFGTIAKMLGAAGLNRAAAGGGTVDLTAGSPGAGGNDRKGWTRIIIEKPFGRDIDSSRELNDEVGRVFNEDQIYRIDHYMGKETVQNIMMFRFANGIFEPIWNNQFIDHVQVLVAETLGVEGRGGYYDTSGALRDIIQNHVFQVLSVMAMEPPISLRPEDIRNEKVKVISAIRPMTPEEILENTVRGQYGPGSIGNGNVQGYRDDSSVNPKSNTETYCAMKLAVDNWRWAGVPFYLRTGKRLPQRVTQVVLQFKRAPKMLFRQTDVEHISPNRLVIHIQPQEGISLQFEAKVPGPAVHLKSVRMNFNYEDHFHAIPQTGYETLIYDVMIGDSTLFPRFDMVDASWQIATPILDVWQSLPARHFPNYAAGAWGPDDANKLLAKDGRKWYIPQ